VTPTGSDLIVDRAVGVGAEELTGMSFSLAEVAAGEAVASGQPVVIEDARILEAHGFDEQTLLGNAMVIPFTVGEGRSGVLSLARLSGRPEFGARDLDMGKSFAAHISVSIDRAEAGMIRRRVSLLEERTRIARDLHDHVIQRLFAAGLSLQAVAATLEPESAASVVEQIREIDGSIAQIRQSIFALHRDAEVTSVSLRARVLEIVDRVDSQDVSSPRPMVTFLGPVDLMADAALTDDITAVVAEALANVVRHAHAARIEVVISAAAGHVTVEVTDDGVGPGSSTRLSGLANLRSRADDRGGSFELLPGPSGGTQLMWSVPA
jgi:signal transduction histidine kinase